MLEMLTYGKAESITRCVKYPFSGVSCSSLVCLSHGVYSKNFIIGWTVFALCSPVMAYFARLTKESGIFPKIVSVGIVAVSVLSSILLFDRLRVYDFIIDGVLIYFLFIKKVDRSRNVRSKKNEK